MNSDRRTILNLIAMGRITPTQAERLLAVATEGRETAMILVLCLAYSCLVQLHLHEMVAGLVHFINAQLPAQAVHQALSAIMGPIRNLMPLSRLGGSL
jgi:hypothetical protein